jgi:hypothetical protein
MNRGVKTVVYIIALIAVFFIGLNWRTVEFRETTRYVQGETIRDSIIVPLPYRVEIPKIVHLPMRPDTVFLENEIVIVERVDTAQIIREFISIHHYAFNVFDIETVGRLDVRQSIQYNRLRSFEYDFTPMMREITRYVRSRFDPFASVSANTFNTVGIGGGFFHRNIGVEYQFLRNHSINSSGHQISLKYRFR